VRRQRIIGDKRVTERRRVPRPVMPARSTAAQIKYLLRRVEVLEQLCYAQVRRVTALQTQIDHLEARRK